MSIWGCSSLATYCQLAAAAGFIYCRSQEWALHSPSPAGFVYLEFSWTHAPFVFSNIQPYLPVAIAVLFVFRALCVGAPPSLSGEACHTLAPVGCLPLSKHTGEVVPHPPSWPACLFTVCMRECPSHPLWSSGHPGLFATCLFFFPASDFFSFFFFPWVGVSLSRGLYWFVPGSTACRLSAHLVVCMSQAG
jgi:hypothetical protein